jgi:hypothetical protein
LKGGNGSRAGIPNKRSLVAIADMDRLEIHPIEMLLKVYNHAIKAFENERGNTDKGDAGAGYLSVAGRAAGDLMAYKYPKLSAIAIKDLNSTQEAQKILSTQDAIEILKADPFAPSNADIVAQIEKPIENPVLPIGEKGT